MKKINRYCLFLSIFALIAIMIIAAVNMLFRPFGYPLTGSFELMGYGSAIITGLGLGFSYEQKSHIAVDIVFKKFPKKVRLFLSSIGNMACAIFFFLVSKKMLNIAVGFKESGELSETLRVPFYPVTIAVAFGLFVLSLNIIYSIYVEIKKERSLIK